MIEVQFVVRRATLDVLEDCGMTLSDLAGQVYIGFLTDKDHYSYFGTQQLAVYLSRGFSNIAKRPFIRQVVTEDRQLIEQAINEEIVNYARGYKYASVQELWLGIGERVKKIFYIFANSARIMPPNAPATVRRKGFNKPWVRRGDLLNSMEVSLMGGSA